jgi:hypothetical protein
MHGENGVFGSIRLWFIYYVVLLCEELSRSSIGAAIEVHRNLGPGYLESVYENCLAKELTTLNITFERQEPLEVFDFSVFSVRFFPWLLFFRRSYCLNRRLLLVAVDNHRAAK